MQVAVVTGASAGIGQAAAIRIAEQGMGVVVTYRTRAAEAAETVEQVEAAGGEAVSLQLDVADTAGFAVFVDTVRRVVDGKWNVQRIHALVNNAGIGGGAAFEDVTEETFDRFHSALFKGPYFLTQRMLPLLASDAVIVNVGSTSALETGIESGYSSYASQKGAMHTLTRCWAKELAPRGIRVNAVAPGSTRTRIADDAFAALSSEALDGIAASVAFGRIGEPDDIAAVLAFLAGPASGWITGEVLECSGGQGL